MTRPAAAFEATVELYRNNMFRVIGLPIDATSKMVRRRCEEVRVAGELGVPTPTAGGRLRLDPPPEPGAVNRAAAAWEDPERRLVDELFWLWGPDGGERDTANPTGPDQAMVSAHDHAVEAHCAALDLELLAKRRALTFDERQRLNERWRAANRGWAKVIDDPRIWAHLQRRVMEIDDPRLTNRTVADLKQAMPTRLLAINARLALDAAETSDRGEAQRQRTAMWDLARMTQADTGLVDRALYVVADPTIRRIEAACDEAYSAACDDPRAAPTIGIDLRERLHQPLTVVTVLLTCDHPAAQKAHDGVASTLRQCAVKHYNQVGIPYLQENEWALGSASASAALKLLQQAAELAGTPTTRGEVAAEIATLENEVRVIAEVQQHPLRTPSGYGRRPASADLEYGGPVSYLGCFTLLVLVAGAGLLAVGHTWFGLPVIIIGIVFLVIWVRRDGTS